MWTYKECQYDYLITKAPLHIFHIVSEALCKAKLCEAFHINLTRGGATYSQIKFLGEHSSNMRAISVFLLLHINLGKYTLFYFNLLYISYLLLDL